ncbi:hypothetical protein [Bradyrhizobium sp.]|uniref:hypothetical protein n=1 Tax=Bradyrhizobium sp. TaxID=376 RepID=UPI0025B8B062|nr:hypothetical protein [Bradyrhizobium sp.]
MSRAQPKSSPTDEYAKRIAQAIAKGRPPPFNAAFERYCESSPREIFAAFAGAARHMPPAGKDAPLAFGYMFLLQRLLEHLRYRTEQGYADAANLIADFQADIAAQTETGHVEAGMLALVAGALHQSEIPASPEFAAALEKQPVDLNEDGPLPADVHAALAGILEACHGDPFMAVGSLIETGHSMPVEAWGALASALALANIPAARGAAVLFLLDPNSAVRREVANALSEVAASLTPIEVRRLIAMRNWRPENERAGLDTIIRKARAAGIGCAPWEAGRIESIVATAVDGAAAQGFLLISPAGRKKRISSLLIKGGIADAWSGEPESRRRIEMSLAAAGMDTPKLAVSRSYLDRTVAHHLAISIENVGAPPFGLLQVAETIGGADWQPARLDFGEALAELIGELPKAMCEPAALASVLRKSDELDDLEAVVQSWFEDDPQIAEAVESARGRDRAKLATYLLQSVIARRRDRWADIVLRTALWMREAPPEADLCWRELAIVAKALADGRDMTEIGLMRDIALRTIAALEDAGRMNRAFHADRA